MCEQTKALKNFIRQPYAWPGGYPLFAVMSDGEAICKACAKTEFKLILRSTRNKSRDGWQLAAVSVNWEDASLTCEHCGDRIESAYGEPC